VALLSVSKLRRASALLNAGCGSPFLILRRYFK
jgi:hypothetical protein